MSFVEDIADLVSASLHPLHACHPDWQRKPLSKMARVINGYPFASSAFNRDNGWPIVRIRDVVPGRSETFYSGEVPDGFWLRDGDLLVGMDGDFNIGKWKGGRALLNQRVCKVVPDAEQIVADFLFYLLPGYLKLINEHTSSTTVKHLSSRTLGAIPLPVPPLETQRRIVARIDELFAELDEGEALLSRACDDLETYRKSLLKAAVTGELTADWRAANPAPETGEQLLQRILADRKARWEAEPKNRGKKYVQPEVAELDWPSKLPPEWTWASMAQIVRETEYGTSVKCSTEPSGPPVLRMGNIQDGKLDFDNLKYAPPSIPVPLLGKGDLLFNRTNSAELVGKSAVYNEELTPCSYASYLFAVRFDLVLPDFVNFFINSIFGKAWVAANKSQQVGQANLSAGTLMRMPVPLPPLAEQCKIVSYVEQELAATQETDRDFIRLGHSAPTLRQSILSTAFRGELVQ